MNTKLENDPSLVYGKEGYLIVVAPKKDEIPELRRTLLSKEDYLAKATENCS